MLIEEVIQFLQSFAPIDLGEDCDNVGLILGSSQESVSSVMTCLTLTPDVAQEAVDRNVQMIVSHHPILFRAVKRLTNETSEGRMLLQLMMAGIGVYSPHTCYDSASGGINQQLAELLGLTGIQPIRPLLSVDSLEAASRGSGRYGDLPEAVSLGEVVSLAKQGLGISCTNFVGDLTKSVRRIGVACGAAAEFMSDAKRLGCDVLLTGEARFHACLEARTLDIALILPGHYATERPAMEKLAVVLQQQFPTLGVFASEAESDPVEWSV